MLPLGSMLDERKSYISAPVFQTPAPGLGLLSPSQAQSPRSPHKSSHTENDKPYYCIFSKENHKLFIHAQAHKTIKIRM